MRFLLVVIFMFSFFSFLYAEEVFCDLGSTSGAPSFSKLPTTGTIKAVIIYIKFLDDTTESTNPVTFNWPASLDSLPSWAPNTIDTTVRSDYDDPSISGYFKEMSRDSLDLIGEVCPVLFVPPNPSSYYKTASGRNISYLSKEAINFADTYIDYSNYDNYDPDDYDSDGVFNEPDGTVDMIILCIRSLKGGAADYGHPAQGVASLTSRYSSFNSGGAGSTYSLTLDSVTIKAGNFGSGTIQHQIYDPAFQLAIMAHEIGHYFFTTSFNGGWHLPGTDTFGLMDGTNGSRPMNGFERSKLGWVTPTLVSGNLSNIAIGDAISEGDIYKIPAGSEFYYIENRKGVSYYETTWETVPGKLAAPGFGLLITKSTNSDKKLKIIYADNVSGTGDQDDFFNYDYKRVYSPWSTPANSDNIAFDIVNDSSGVIFVDFFVTNPINSSPSQPQNLQAAWSGSHPQITWDSNPEPDVNSTSNPGQYKIYRKIEGETGWALATTVTHVSGSTQSWIDNAVDKPGKFDDVYTYSYDIVAVDNASKESMHSIKTSIDGTGLMWKVNELNDEKTIIPSIISVNNYPNPFNPQSKITFELIEQSYVTLKVYDIRGKIVSVLVDKVKETGIHTSIFNGEKLSSGTYIYRFTVSGLETNRSFTDTKRMLLIK